MVNKREYAKDIILLLESGGHSTNMIMKKLKGNRNNICKTIHKLADAGHIRQARGTERKLRRGRQLMIGYDENSVTRAGEWIIDYETHEKDQTGKNIELILEDYRKDAKRLLERLDKVKKPIFWLNPVRSTNTRMAGAGVQQRLKAAPIISKYLEIVTDLFDLGAALRLRIVAGYVHPVFDKGDVEKYEDMIQVAALDIFNYLKFYGNDPDSPQIAEFLLRAKSHAWQMVRNNMRPIKFANRLF